MKNRSLTSILFTLAFATGLGVNAITLDSTTGRDLGVFVPALGEDADPQVETTLGQTFIPPVDNPYLNTFSVWVWVSSVAHPCGFERSCSCC